MMDEFVSPEVWICRAEGGRRLCRVTLGDQGLVPFAPEYRGYSPCRHRLLQPSWRGSCDRTCQDWQSPRSLLVFWPRCRRGQPRSSAPAIQTARSPPRPGRMSAANSKSNRPTISSWPPPTRITSATFTGLLTGATPSVGEVVVEIYRVFPKDSDGVGRAGRPLTPNVPTRANSPSDVAFASGLGRRQPDLRDQHAAGELHRR